MTRDVQVKPTQIGSHRFSHAFVRLKREIMTPFVLIESVASWLGDGWSEARCMQILEKESWILSNLGATTDGGLVGLSPLGIAMLVAHADPDAGHELKALSADLVLDWIVRRKAAALR